MQRLQSLGIRLSFQMSCEESECEYEDLVISNIDYLHRNATKKSGPTVTSFLKKMQEQMGVAIVGVAAYRDDTGRLCTFEYVTFLMLIGWLRSHSYIVSAPRIAEKTHFPRHILRILKTFLGNGASGSQRMVLYTNLYLFHLLTSWF